MAVLEELGSKLTDIVGIKVGFPLSNDEDLVMKVYSRLCLLYDEAWDFEATGISCKQIQRRLNLVGIGHLCPTAADVTDRRRLPRIWSAFVGQLEQRHGSHGLYQRLRKVLKQQQILAARRDAERDRWQRGGEAAHGADLADASVCSTLSHASQEAVGFAKPLPRAPAAHGVFSSASPTRAGRSRIPVPQRPNVIPTGRQLPAHAGSPADKPVHRLLSQLVVANKRLSGSGNLSYVLSEVAPVRRSVDESPEPTAGSNGGTPRRRSLIPAAVTVEQALGQYIEDRLNVRFPADDAAPERQAAAPAVAAAGRLDLTFSAERPAAPSPAAQTSAAGEPADAFEEESAHKENVEPFELAEMRAASEVKSVDGNVETNRDARRGTFEVTPAQSGAKRDSVAGIAAATPSETQVMREGQLEVLAPADNTEVCTPAEGLSEPATSAADLKTDAADVHAALAVPPEKEVLQKRRSRAKQANEENAACPSSEMPEPAEIPEEQVPKKRRGQPKKNKPVENEAPSSGQPALSVPPEPDVPLKRRNRAKKPKPIADDDANITSPEMPTPALPIEEETEKRPGRAEKSKPEAEEDAASQTRLRSGSEPEVLVEKELPEKRRGRTTRATPVAEEDAGVALIELPAPELPAENEIPGKRRGRSKAKPVAGMVPPGHGDEESASSERATPPPAQEAPKKRRGRSRKAKPAADEVAGDSSVEGVCPPKHPDSARCQPPQALPGDGPGLAGRRRRAKPGIEADVEAESETTPITSCEEQAEAKDIAVSGETGRLESSGEQVPKSKNAPRVTRKGRQVAPDAPTTDEISAVAAAGGPSELAAAPLQVRATRRRTRLAVDDGQPELDAAVELAEGDRAQRPAETARRQRWSAGRAAPFGPWKTASD
ncbi:nucleolar and coiled-body phosphoprotein 1-like [Pollicipes pollicipes]|uniref:nucleolar and coiled-body phosphoprotein 1-like n=1 Tax=Pollicipes pollicipes TaxID=41117 RepID=UPI00188546A6|nr:nucleolar and coiled-body phosphoprotein 1-like [Pollicipes pollicipes]